MDEPQIIAKGARISGVLADGYLAEVYRDQPLITKIDEKNWPVSSSSLPSIMVRMLEALDVHALGEPKQQDYHLIVEKGPPRLIIGPYTFSLSR